VTFWTTTNGQLGRLLKPPVDQGVVICKFAGFVDNLVLFFFFKTMLCEILARFHE